jgi:muconolactone D-isomerase
MLYHVRMDVHLPHDLTPETREQIVREEKDYAQALQREGRWIHLWRIVGEYSNYSIFDVESNDELHTILSQLPLFRHMTIHVTPLAQHPSGIHAG